MLFPTSAGNFETKDMTGMLFAWRGFCEIYSFRIPSCVSASLHYSLGCHFCHLRETEQLGLEFADPGLLFVLGEDGSWDFMALGG